MVGIRRGVISVVRIEAVSHLPCVGHSVVVRVATERTRPRSDLRTVLKAVVVRVGIERVCAEGELVAVVQSVSIRISVDWIRAGSEPESERKAVRHHVLLLIRPDKRPALRLMAAIDHAPVEHADGRALARHVRRDRLVVDPNREVRVVRQYDLERRRRIRVRTVVQPYVRIANDNVFAFSIDTQADRGGKMRTEHEIVPVRGNQDVVPVLRKLSRSLVAVFVARHRRSVRRNQMNLPVRVYRDSVKPDTADVNRKRQIGGYDGIVKVAARRRKDRRVAFRSRRHPRVRCEDAHQVRLKPVGQAVAVRVGERGRRSCDVKLLKVAESVPVRIGE